MIEAQVNQRATHSTIAKPYIAVIQIIATYYGFVADLIKCAQETEENVSCTFPTGRYIVAGSLAGAMTIAGLWKLKSYYQQRQEAMLQGHNQGVVVAQNQGPHSALRRSAILFLVLNRTLTLLFDRYTNSNELDSDIVTNTTLIFGMALAVLAAALALKVSSVVANRQELPNDRNTRNNTRRATAA